MCSLNPSRQLLLAIARPDDQATEFFEGFEHERSGKKAMEELLKLLTRGKREIKELNPLTLPNGIKIKFEEIVALAGDLYGLPNQPIIDPAFNNIDQEDSGRYQRFRDA